MTNSTSGSLGVNGLLAADERRVPAWQNRVNPNKLQTAPIRRRGQWVPPVDVTGRGRGPVRPPHGRAVIEVDVIEVDKRRAPVGSLWGMAWGRVPAS